MNDKAVALHRSAGQWEAALKICLLFNLLESLRGVCLDLRESIKQIDKKQQNNYKQIINAAAAFLFKEKHIQEAIQLLLAGRLLLQVYRHLIKAKNPQTFA